MIRADGVTYTVNGRTLLSGISLDLVPGHLIVAVGPNGAGKSTLLRLLTGELKPSVGRVAIDDTDMASWAADKLALRRAVVAQHSVLGFAFTVIEVVLLGMSVPGISPANRKAQDAAHAMLQRLGLGDLSHRIYTSLSGGERQRVHIARALCQLEASGMETAETALLVDEPTSSLDIAHQLVVLEELQRQAQAGRAVFAILHDLNLAAGFADEILLLSEGRALALGKAGDVLQDRLLSEAFRCDVRMNRTPADGAPYLLPQMCGELSPPG